MFRAAKKVTNTVIVFLWSGITEGDLDAAWSDVQARAANLPRSRFGVMVWRSGNNAIQGVVTKAREFSPAEVEAIIELFESDRFVKTNRCVVRNPAPLKILVPVVHTADPAGWAAEHGWSPTAIRGEQWGGRDYHAIYLVPEGSRIERPRWKRLSHGKGVWGLFGEIQNPAAEKAAEDAYIDFHWGEEPEQVRRIQSHTLRPQGFLYGLGQLVSVTYRASKGGQEADWVHAFGEGGGELPLLAADESGRLYVVGGSYSVSRAGIVG